MDSIYEYTSIHETKVFYSEDGDEYKKRPIVIIECEDNTIYYFRITSKEGKENQKKYRSPILNWRKCGLTKPSFIDISNPISHMEKKLLGEKTFLSHLSEYDVQTLESKMNELGY
ncbi:hypothetical protein RW115_12130 [Macrococcus capreoli]